MESIIHDEHDICYLCGGYATETHHCIHGYGRRKLADELTVRLCHSCHANLHDHGSFDRELQRIAQARWMEYYGKSEDDFRLRYGKSYLI